MSEKPFGLVATGSMVVDRIALTPRLLGSEEKVLLQPDPEGRVVREQVGGVMLNAVGWASLFGLRSAIFGKQADDAEGRFLRAGMRALGIEARLDLSGRSSSFAHVYVDPEGGRAIYMARGATAELSPAEIDSTHADTIASGRMVASEISQLPLATVRRVFERAREAGATTVLDVDVPLADAVPLLGTEDDLHAVLSLADWLKPSLAALHGLVSGDTPEALARALAEKYGAQVVAITDGARGSLVHADGEVVRAPAARIEAIDSTGAGDAFSGGLLAGRALGLGWRDAALLGNACGAACCERLGAFPDAPESDRARALALYGELGGAALDPVASRATAAAAAAAGTTHEDTTRFLGAALAELQRAADTVDPAALAAAAARIARARETGGRVHVTGVGKPEHVAHYAASLLSSTGTPATFLHATEAIHGSLGQVVPGDVVIAISNSGTTRELLDTVGALREHGAVLIAVTRDPASALARAADEVLVARVEHEGGPLDLAPRASILAEILVLSALSVELQARLGLTRADYHARHPAGALGRASRES